MKKLWKFWTLLFSSIIPLIATPALPQATRKALLPKGILLQSLKDQKMLSLPRDIYAHIAQDNPPKIINYRGDALYVIPRDQNHKVTLINEVSDLYQDPKFYKEYFSKKSKTQKPPTLNQNLSFGFHYSTAKFLNHLKSSKNGALIGLGTSYEANFDFNAPISLGIKLNYTRAQVEPLISHQFSLGPIITYPLVSLGIENFSAQFSIQSSLFFSVRDTLTKKNFNFHSQSLLLGLQHPYSYQSIDFIFNIFLSKDFISIKNQNSGGKGEEKMILNAGLSW